MQIIIQKFGGSSLVTKENRESAINHVLEAVKNGYKPIVVVSAMGRRGDPYATDTLLDLAFSENSNPNEKALAFLLSCGESISASIICQNMLEKNLLAVPINGSMAGIITSDNYLDGTIKKIQNDNILKYLREGFIPVVTGFQGVNERGEITTLGRGGSDTTAVALGAALGADRVEIFTDVIGLMTADPDIVPDARRIEKVSYNEVLQMAQEGAKVIHPRAVEVAMEFNVPVVIKSTYENVEGTLVTNFQEDFSEKLNDGRIITGVTHINNLAQIIVFTPASELEDKMFQLLAKRNISIDLINIFPDKKAFTVMADKTKNTINVLEELGVEFEVNKNLSKVTIIGVKMRGVPGVMSRIVTALKKSNVTILQTADSHINISCLVKEENIEKAVCALHKEFSLEKL